MDPTFATILIVSFLVLKVVLICGAVYFGFKFFGVPFAHYIVRSPFITITLVILNIVFPLSLLYTVYVCGSYWLVRKACDAANMTVTEFEDIVEEAYDAELAKQRCMERINGSSSHR